MHEANRIEQAAARIYLDLAGVYEDTDPKMAGYHRDCARAILQNDEVARFRAHRKIVERLSEFMIGDYQDPDPELEAIKQYVNVTMDKVTEKGNE